MKLESLGVKSEWWHNLLASKQELWISKDWKGRPFDFAVDEEEWVQKTRKLLAHD